MNEKEKQMDSRSINEGNSFANGNGPGDDSGWERKQVQPAHWWLLQ